MTRSGLLLLGATLGAVAGACIVSAATAKPARSGSRLMVTQSYLDIPWAERAIATLDSISGPVQVIIDTYGGQVTAVAMLLKAMYERKHEVTAIVPRLAFSGGTLIALCSRRIVAGPRAYFSPVDPQIGECAAIELKDSMAAAQYYEQIRQWVERLTSDLAIESAKRKGLLDLLLGRVVPHGWPLAVEDLKSAGLPIDIDRRL